ncbi:MAG TPA: SH3 domain-containing protein [Candidatus Lachnoclostridium stercorigallinarum]|uniref:SH3 domain-containing protein n=1 Tax=Candidatus Lachnoclostridium stercorigallinarum TaxID=2838634 RepID=A0A9D2GG36_9FIRM|nr:SH3 domain-containing protein [Candidatus Lachnoclostridium stercorigallinarum]
MKRTAKRTLGIILLLVLAAAAVLGVWLARRYMPSHEAADVGELFPAEGNHVSIVWNEEVQEAEGIYEENQVYLPLQWVNDNLNERFYWDSGEQLLVYALPDQIVYADADTMGEGGRLLRVEDDGVYLSAGLVAGYTDIRSVYFDNPAVHDGGEDQTAARRIYIDSTWEEEQRATLRWNAAVRQRGGVKSPVITETESGTGVKILEEMDNWSYVRTDTGFMGYVHNWKLTDRETVTPESTFQAPVYESQSLGERVSLVWHQVTTQDANNNFDQMIAGVKGVNVVAPTWFSLTDNEGNFRSLASREYVEKAHDRGMQVWALLDNFSDNVQTEVLLSSTSTRRKLIDGLIDEVLQYDIDGLNLDFESIKPKAGVHYIQFIRELSIDCRANGIILSVDNYVPSAYTEFYNRKEQGVVADYVIVMAYDEHYAGGEMGTVSSISYVKNGLADTMEMVPKEKVIGAVPFYTRIWTVKDGETTSRAVGMEAAQNWVEENQVELKWLDDVGQYYGELEGEDGSVQYIWMEDARSLGLKTEAVDGSGAAGIAFWKLGFEPDEIWDVVNP